MTNKNEFYKDVSSLVGVEIVDSTVVFDDLGIEGLDAIEFMKHIARKYGVDMTTYDPELYHTSEADLANIFLTIYRLIFARKKLNKISFPAKHLFEVVQKGKWFDPVDN